MGPQGIVTRLNRVDPTNSGRTPRTPRANAPTTLWSIAMPYKPHQPAVSLPAVTEVEPATCAVS